MDRFFNLKSYNSFGLNVVASYFASLESVEALKALMDEAVFKENKRLVLGGGSNILFLDDFFEGLVIHYSKSGWEVLEEDENEVLICAHAGTDWSNFVDDMVEKGFYGLENLSLIPGNVGAAPMQNIGAYGVELKDCFVQLEALDFQTGKQVVFDRPTCDFGYRSSVFKQGGKGRYLVLSVQFRLKKQGNLNMAYGNISDYLNEQGLENPSLKDLSEAIKSIRRSKLPDPHEIGNSGSFFKNPVMHQLVFEQLQKEFPEIPAFPATNNTVKIPAAWLIDRAGWKGYRKGDAGVHKNQALVLVNYGKASGRELFALAMQIQLDVNKKFGIFLEPEVNIV
ncbi:MAG: UDP-N-acetylmuramate dehydrogenase [Bacteroidetes bacterium]|nr:UDP-N-acetylmuramate dehydrogenase [Bacteroidota bacterium]